MIKIDQWILDPTNHYKEVPAKNLVEALGLIPEMLELCDPELELAEQLNILYTHGGGWSPFDGHKMHKDGSIEYPGDPKHYPIAEFRHGTGEVLRMYPHAFVSITQPDGTFEVSRMD
jgi:hypothetical protein